MNTILQNRIEEVAFQESSMYSTVQEKNAAYNTGMKIATFALQNQWISVEEELPKEKGAYHVVIQDNLYSRDGEFLRREVWYDTYLYDPNSKSPWESAIHNVTHWAEIPSLKGGEE